MLEKDPAARFPHARAVMIALDRAMAEMRGAPRTWAGLTRGQIGALAAAVSFFLIVVIWAVAR
jgi:hypothetical protein